MAIRQQVIHPVGMRQDDVINSANNSSNFAVDVKNLRFNTIDDLTTGVWTTEKGNINVDLQIVDGLSPEEYAELNTLIHSANAETIIGNAVINNKWILFGILKNTQVKKDFILKVFYENETLKVDLLFSGNLNFSAEHPLETMPYYENEVIQKVYWTDNYNQPRFINIDRVRHRLQTTATVSDQFDFVRKVSLDENVYCWKESGQNGIWNAGTVKYALTYFNKYGQESNIIWTSTLLYPTIGERGCDAEEISGDLFHIMVHVSKPMIDSWDCIRLYSIYRSSEGAKPIVKIVEDRPLLNPLTNETINDILNTGKWYHFTDSNTTGVLVDSDRLMFVGGKELLCETFDQKDGTMFMGNITLKKKSIEALVEEEWKKHEITDQWPEYNQLNSWFVDSTDLASCADFIYSKVINFNGEATSYNSGYTWKNQLNIQQDVQITADGVQIYQFVSPTIFKYGEWYRFGIQFQDDHGNWSEVHHLRDCQNTLEPTNGDFFLSGVFKYILPQRIAQILTDNGYIKARLVYCPPTNGNRRILSQGLIGPTMCNQKWEEKHSPDCFHPYFYSWEDLDGAKFTSQSPRGNTREEIAAYSTKNWEILSYVPTWYLFSAQNRDVVFHNSLAAMNIPSIRVFNYGWWDEVYNASGSTTVANALLNWYWDDVLHGTGHTEYLEKLFDKYNDSRFKLYNNEDLDISIVEMVSPDLEFDDSIRTLDYSKCRCRTVGDVIWGGLHKYCYLDWSNPAMDYVGQKGQFENFFNGTAFIKSGHYGFLERLLLTWNDIDVYNANSLPSNDEDEDGHSDNDSGTERQQYKTITYDYYIYPFHRKYLNNYMGDLAIQMYRKGKDPEYQVQESAIIKQKTYAYLQYFRTVHYADSDVYAFIKRDITNESSEIQIFDAVGDATLRFKYYTQENNERLLSYLTYLGNINTIAPLCNYKEIWGFLTPYNTYGFNEHYGRLGDQLPWPVYPNDAAIHPFTGEKLENINGVYTATGRIRLTDPFFTLYNPANGSNALQPQNLLYQPLFETPIFKYQGLNIYADGNVYINVDTNRGDMWRANWSAGDWWSIGTGIGWIGALFNTAWETQEDWDHYQFTPIQRSMLPEHNWETELGQFIVNIIFGNIAGLIEQIVDWCSDADVGTAHVLNIYKGAYPIPVFVNSKGASYLSYQAKLGKYLISEPTYLSVSENLFDSEFVKRVLNNADGDNVNIGSMAKVVAETIRTRLTWPVGVSSDSVPFAYKTSAKYVMSVPSDSFNFLMGVNDRKVVDFIGEIYRDVYCDPDVLEHEHRDTSFGNIELSAYIPCSQAVQINPNYDTPVYHTEGDHYYMRYDNLFTYPYSDPAINGIVEIASFPVETRINLDGRCDKHRGLQDNTLVRNNNFNIINKAYTQQDNYFTYFCIDDLARQLDKFHNSITWSKTKVNGELIDNWANVTLVNTADCDGVCGEITSIQNVNNNLIMFQEHGIAQIGYNEKTAISVENGLPLEIANSGKFTGFNYISKEFGCQNKWSISNNHLGLMYIDDSRNELLGYNQNGVDQVSKKAGFDSFFINELASAETSWTPERFTNFITFYDKISKDLYFLNKNKCLTFNETSNSFTAFYDYNNISAMANVGNHFLMWGGSRGAEVQTSVVEISQDFYPTDNMEHLVRIIQVIDENDASPRRYYWDMYNTAGQYSYLDLLDSVVSDNMNILYQYNANNSTETSPVGNLIIIPFSTDYTRINWTESGHSDYSLSYYANPDELHGHYCINIKWQSDNSTHYLMFEIILDASNANNTCTAQVICMDSDLPEDRLSKLRIVAYTLESSEVFIVVGNIEQFNNPALEGMTQSQLEQYIADHPQDFNPLRAVSVNEDPYGQIWNDAVPYMCDSTNNVRGTFTIDVYSANPSTSDNHTNPKGISVTEYGITNPSIKFHGAMQLSTPTTLPMYEPEEPNVTTIEYTQTLHSGIWATRENKEYSKFFNEYSPYWMTLMSDGGSELRIFDKIFNTVEYRADLFDEDCMVDNYGINAYLFTDISAWNGYQFYKDFDILDKRDENAVYPFERNLDNRYEWQSERKFNVWRTIVPRATYKDENNEFYTSRDRIRNPFTFIKLTNYHPEFNRQPDGVGSHRMVLHDFTINFDVK